jgi:hypothetical protein
MDVSMVYFNTLEMAEAMGGTSREKYFWSRRMQDVFMEEKALEQNHVWNFD